MGYGSVNSNLLISGFCRKIKSQISSTKLQTNLKFQSPITIAFTAEYHINSRIQVFVWNFEFSSLEFVWDLIFGAWNFLNLRFPS